MVAHRQMLEGGDVRERDSYLVVAPAPLPGFGQGALVETVPTFADARRRLAESPFDAVFLAAAVAGQHPAARLRELRAVRADAVVTLLTGAPEADEALELAIALQVRTTRENRRLTDQLVRREKMSALGRLVAGLCHEFNNPLAFILSNTENLAEYARDLRRVIEAYRDRLGRLGVRDPAIEALESQIDLPFVLEDAERAAHDATGGGKRLRELIAALRTYAGSDNHECVPTDLRKVAGQALAILAKAIRDRANVELAAPPAAIAQANAAAVTQVIVALVQNALDGFGDRPAAHNRVRVVIEPRGADHMAVVVEDNGPGVPAPLRERIFDPFFTTKPQGKGIGLGLSMAARIADDHRGALVLEPADAGARFALLLPVAAPG